eukprot:CAMPEP_0181222748 /NCGR_PEP_ID=MMETSP1096-20121128/30136_1 /TAXON_ID=156174 ORGANISM="Chrysochromulina ericina, Strain CCMP281" /NCGR_SAMPLE_ID=MMETSP1096 /ASSEMBLY_ACC=CAM_ASM_000453 /LENGTH=165 /DNA_ID=CAMNT_0023315539 /DNA_START=393 /DNA_END=890 /DNA_ORIENTATION=-
MIAPSSTSRHVAYTTLKPRGTLPGPVPTLILWLLFCHSAAVLLIMSRATLAEARPLPSMQRSRCGAKRLAAICVPQLVQVRVSTTCFVWLPKISLPLMRGISVICRTDCSVASTSAARRSRSVADNPSEPGSRPTSTPSSSSVSLGVSSCGVADTHAPDTSLMMS